LELKPRWLVAKVCNECLIPLIADMSEGKVALIFSTLGYNAKKLVTKVCMESSDQSFNSLINSGTAKVNLLCKALGIMVPKNWTAKIRK